MFRPSDLQTFKRSHDVQTYPLCIQIVAHSFALFCTHKNMNSFIFKRFRTLWPKHRGVGYPLTSRNKGVLDEVNVDRAAKDRVAPSKSQVAAPLRYRVGRGHRQGLLIVVNFSTGAMARS